MAISEIFKVLYLNEVHFLEKENAILTIDRVKVKSKGTGPELTIFPNCRIIITQKRFIISQKMLWRKKYRVHYFIWLDSQEPVNKILKGMVELSTKLNKIIVKEKSVDLIPDDTSIITKLIISKYNHQLVEYLTQLT